MKRDKRGLAVAAWLTVAGLVAVLVPGGPGMVPPRADAQSDESLQHLRDLADYGRSVRDRLTPPVSRGQPLDPQVLPLSAGGLELATLGDRLQTLSDVVGEAGQIRARSRAQVQRPRTTRRVTRRAAEGDHTAPAVVQVSDPYEDGDFLSRLAGMTQSETSVAWCGSAAVVGFNDSGSFVSSMLGMVGSQSGSFSFEGWSVSTDGGANFTDRGAVLSDPLPSSVRSRDLFGDPVVGCARESTFYYASLATDRPRSGGGVSLSGIALSKSEDNGQNFAGATMAVAKDAATHLLDKPWMTVVPGATPDADIIHVVYTDFDSSRSSGVCDGLSRTAIEYVRSVDGGATWLSPTVIDEVCGFTSFVQGAQVRTGPTNDVFVAWERYPTGRTPPRQILVRRSLNLGATFGPAATVAGDVIGVGDGSELQGNFRAFIDLQGLAIDRSTGPGRGRAYIAWHDGRNRNQTEPFGSPGCLVRPPGQPASYCFGDILFSRSTSTTSTSWSTPVRVNNDPQDGAPVDHFMPSLEVDSSGTVFAFFYDRRNDDRNFLIDAFLARSSDGGGSWVNQRVSPNSFPPITGWQDRVVNSFYMGDYIGVAADRTGANPGALVAWGDNSRGDANVLGAQAP